MLLHYAADMSFRDAEVKRLESKVVNELSQYDGICKHSREEVKATFSAREKELVRKRQLDRIRERNPRNRQMIVSFPQIILTFDKECKR